MLLDQAGDRLVEMDRRDAIAKELVLSLSFVHLVEGSDILGCRFQAPDEIGDAGDGHLPGLLVIHDPLPVGVQARDIVRLGRIGDTQVVLRGGVPLHFATGGGTLVATAAEPPVHFEAKLDDGVGEGSVDEPVLKAFLD